MFLLRANRGGRDDRRTRAALEDPFAVRRGADAAARVPQKRLWRRVRWLGGHGRVTHER